MTQGHFVATPVNKHAVSWSDILIIVDFVHLGDIWRKRWDGSPLRESEVVALPFSTVAANGQTHSRASCVVTFVV